MREHDLQQRYQQTRRKSLQACEPLELEDFGLQADAFTSPPKWHLAHTSWFFETFLLQPFLPCYQSPNEQYQMLFNSYYNGVGKQFSRPQRGLLSRPTVAEVLAYRTHVDNAMLELLEHTNHQQRQTIVARSYLGIAHEQQHQELFYTDLKYALYANPLFPAHSSEEQLAYSATPGSATIANLGLKWQDFAGGLTTVGTASDDRSATDPSGKSRFVFDNEGPSHRVYLQPFALSNRLVTNAEFQEFIDDGGYRRPEFWLADGWAIVEQQQWRQPLYWLDRDGQQLHFTLHGLQARQAHQPVCHLSGFEADAYACWADARLPTEFEWEFAATLQPMRAPEIDTTRLHPAPASDAAALSQLYNECWQWTGSAYRPYPGFKASVGAIGEYNGKFMANQWVLRGGSCVSASAHLGPTYRNFFYPHDRWQFSGLRMAKDL